MSNNPISTSTTSSSTNNSSSTSNTINNKSSSSSGNSAGAGEWRAPRIAIVDIDIHHGNGTEEIVRNLRYSHVHLLLVSLRIASVMLFWCMFNRVIFILYHRLYAHLQIILCSLFYFSFSYCSPRMVHLPLPSSWAPVSTLSYKPWLNEQDTKEVFFSSVHLYAGKKNVLLLMFVHVRL